ncbi:MAG: AI-2E family transporter, partial [Pseudomonadota bacterium]
MQQLTEWFKRQLSNPQVVYLTSILVVGFLIVLYAGNMLAPVLASLVIAYLLEGIVRKVALLKVPRIIAVIIVFFAFFLFLVAVVFGLIPLLYNQLTDVIQ